MEKLLRFKDRNYDEVFYPLSKLRGFSRRDSACGSCLFIHFDPLRSTTQSEAGSGATDFDTDHVKIKFSDAGVLNAAIKNLMVNISASKVIVDVFIVNGDSLQAHAFSLKNDNFDAYICAPGYSVAANCAGATWNSVLEIHMVQA